MVNSVDPNFVTVHTFRRKVGLAFCFMRPVHHQVSIATETVGDLICVDGKIKGELRKVYERDIRKQSDYDGGRGCWHALDLLYLL